MYVLLSLFYAFGVHFLLHFNCFHALAWVWEGTLFGFQTVWATWENRIENGEWIVDST